MVYTKPSIYKIAAFDAITDTAKSIGVGFIGLESKPATINGLLNVYENDTDTLVGTGNTSISLIKTSTTDTSSLTQYSFTIPSPYVGANHSLNNGQGYYLTVTVGINLGELQITSDGSLFYCFTTPVFTFTNIPSTPLKQSSFNVKFNYTQAENKQLNWYRCYLCPSNVSTTEFPPINPIQTSPKLYDSNYMYKFSNLYTNTSYRMVIEGNTVYGTNFYSAYSDVFTVSLSIYANSPLILLENVCDEGYISVSSFINDIPGELGGSATLENPIDLTSNGDYVLWDNGFFMSGNATLHIWGRNFNLNTPIVEMTLMSNNVNIGSITMMYISDQDNVSNIVFTLDVIDQNGVIQHIQSNSITTPSSTDWIYINMQKIDYMYNLFIKNLGVITW